MLRRRFLSAVPLSAASLSVAGFTCLGAVPPARALSLEPAPAHLRLEAPQTEGALDWSLLAQAGETRLQDGAVISRFPAAVRALDNREVTLFGYMMPFREGATHAEFLLGALQFHCPGCMAGTLSRIVAVRAASPVAYVEEPLQIRGRLRLLEDEQSPLFYRLEDAQAI